MPRRNLIALKTLKNRKSNRKKNQAIIENPDSTVNDEDQHISGSSNSEGSTLISPTKSKKRKRNDQKDDSLLSSGSFSGRNKKSTPKNKKRRSHSKSKDNIQPENSDNGDNQQEENTCSICLGEVENQSFTDSCFHTFCFVCLLEWARVKPICPLCKQSFYRIIHNVRSLRDYDEYHLRIEPQVSDLAAGEGGAAPRFRYRTTMTGNRHQAFTSTPDDDFIPGGRLTTRQLWRRQRQSSTADFRRRVYANNLRVRQNETVHGRLAKHRRISADFFSRNPAQIHRLVPWLNRELTCILSRSDDEHKHFVLELILDLIKRYEITSDEFQQHLLPFTGNYTDHFIHEFLNYARSPHNLVIYDRTAVYDTLPSTVQEPSLVIDDDDVVICGETRPNYIRTSTTLYPPRQNYLPPILSPSPYPTPQMINPADLSYTSAMFGTSNVLSRFQNIWGGISNLDPRPASMTGWQSPPMVSLEPTCSIVEPVRLSRSLHSPHQDVVIQTSDSNNDTETVEIVGYEEPFDNRTPINLSSEEDSKETNQTHEEHMISKRQKEFVSTSRKKIKWKKGNHNDNYRSKTTKERNIDIQRKLSHILPNYVINQNEKPKRASSSDLSPVSYLHKRPSSSKDLYNHNRETAKNRRLSKRKLKLRKRRKKHHKDPIQEYYSSSESSDSIQPRYNHFSSSDSGRRLDHTVKSRESVSRSLASKNNYISHMVSSSDGKTPPKNVEISSKKIASDVEILTDDSIVEIDYVNPLSNTPSTSLAAFTKPSSLNIIVSDSSNNSDIEVLDESSACDFDKKKSNTNDYGGSTSSEHAIKSFKKHSSGHKNSAKKSCKSTSGCLNSTKPSCLSTNVNKSTVSSLKQNDQSNSPSLNKETSSVLVSVTSRDNDSSSVQTIPDCSARSSPSFSDITCSALLHSSIQVPDISVETPLVLSSPTHPVDLLEPSKTSVTFTSTANDFLSPVFPEPVVILNDSFESEEKCNEIISFDCNSYLKPVQDSIENILSILSREQYSENRKKDLQVLSNNENNKDNENQFLKSKTLIGSNIKKMNKASDCDKSENAHLINHNDVTQINRSCIVESQINIDQDQLKESFDTLNSNKDLKENESLLSPEKQNINGSQMKTFCNLGDKLNQNQSNNCSKNLPDLPENNFKDTNLTPNNEITSSNSSKQKTKTSPVSTNTPVLTSSQTSHSSVTTSGKHNTSDTKCNVTQDADEQKKPKKDLSSTKESDLSYDKEDVLEIHSTSSHSLASVSTSQSHESDKEPHSSSCLNESRPASLPLIPALINKIDVNTTSEAQDFEAIPNFSAASSSPPDSTSIDIPLICSQTSDVTAVSLSESVSTPVDPEQAVPSGLFNLFQRTDSIEGHLFNRPLDPDPENETQAVDSSSDHATLRLDNVINLDDTINVDDELSGG